ncbi:VCBS repeat-containing protein [Paracoccus xiamenensis]|uniref:VCBS repeat-containing protein n=1 Tax=Paracoccus xiamenensis TaxID=2714901 RepID=UPI0014074F83|nr:VCBS repeat-containing protein [Paracoccus xiamenensis]NHF72601.1 VCBS repeat-containing protein [Paracoccus xiamenensis]
MRIPAVLAAFVACLPAVASAETEIRASFENPATAADYEGDWPIWSRVRLKNARSGRSEESLARGSLALTWHLDVDPGGFFLGDMPAVADIDNDGRSDLVTIQRDRELGWRVLVADLPMNGIEFLTEARFAPAITEVVLLGVADFDGDGLQEIAAVASGDNVDALLIYRWQGAGKPLAVIGPFMGFAPGPVDAGPRLRECDGKIAFLAAYVDAGVVVAIRPSDKPDTVTYDQVAGSADKAGFAAARACS